MALPEKQYRPALLLTLLLSILQSAALLGQAWLLSGLADAVFLQHTPLAALKRQLLLFLLFLLLVALFAFLERSAADRMAFRIKRDATEALVEKLDRVGFLYAASSSRSFSLLDQGVDRLEEYYARLLPQLLKCAVAPILFLAFVFPSDWISGLILLLTLPLIVLFMLLIGRFSKRAAEKQWAALQRISGFLKDSMRYLPWLKLWGRAEDTAVHVDALADDFRQRSFSMMKIAFLSAFVLEFFTMLGIAMVAVGLGLRLTEGMLGFRTALFLILLAPEFYAPLRALGSRFHDSLNARAAVQELDDFLSGAEPQRGASFPHWQAGPELVFRDASYHYANGERGVEALDFCLPAGSVAVVMGESGSGKSTLLRLAGGMLLPQTGELLYNGENSAALCMEALRQNVGLLSQELHLFSASVCENITLGREDVSPEALKALCRSIGADNFIEKLPQGYETQLGEGGQALSGGQKQLIGIARLLLRDCRLLLCDEPTAGLDPESEAQVISALQKLLPGRTVLIVSHRRSVTSLADFLWQMKDGRLFPADTQGGEKE